MFISYLSYIEQYLFPSFLQYHRKKLTEQTQMSCLQSLQCFFLYFSHGISQHYSSLRTASPQRRIKAQEGISSPGFVHLGKFQ